jgi:hypothetical protein
MGDQDGVPAQEREDKGRAEKGCGPGQSDGKAQGVPGTRRCGEKPSPRLPAFPATGF